MPIQFMKGSFASGELSPQLYARVDFGRYHTGAKNLTNMFVHPQGGVSNRAGFKYLARPKYRDKKVRLVPFVFDREQAYMLEFGERYIRFFYNYGQIVVNDRPYEVATDYRESDLKYIRVVQSSDTLFIFCRDKKPKRLIRYGHTSWVFQDFPFILGPFLTDRSSEAKVRVVVDSSSPPSGSRTFDTPGNYLFVVPEGIDSVDVSVQGGGGSDAITTVTTSAESSSFGTLTASGSDTDIAERLEFAAISQTSGTQVAVRVGAGATGTNASGVEISGASGLVSIKWNGGVDKQVTGTMYSDKPLFKPEHAGALWKLRQNVAGESVTHPDSKALTCYNEWFLETSGFWAGTLYVQSFDEDNGEWRDIRVLNSSKDKNYSISGSVEEPTKIRLTSENYVAAAPKNTEVDKTQLGKAVLQTRATTYDGVVRISSYQSATQVKVTIQKEIAVTDKWTALWYEGAWSEERGYPSCGGFFQDRLCVGGTAADPFMLYMSCPGDYTNFETSLPAKDDDAILARILARQNGRIREIVPAGDLIILTDVGEFKLAARDNAALSPTNIDVTPQSNRGCAIVDPVLIGNQLVFTQAGGSVLRDFGYTLEVDGYAGNDVTVLASHLFRERSVIDMDYQGAPDSIVWCVRDDGMLLGLTYMREQEVFAWHKHITKGKFEAVSVLPTPDGDDDVYFVVERENGKFIEYMGDRLQNDDLTGAFFVDCGLVYKGDPATVIYGLDHLANQEVSILADGFLIPGQTVREIGEQAEWGIELDRPASKVIVGLPYSSELETLNMEVSQQGRLQGRKKHTPKVIIRVHNSVGARIGVDREETVPIKWNEMADPLDDQAYLFTGDKEVLPFSGYKDDGCIRIVQPDPLPLTVLGVIPVLEVGG